MPQLDPINKLAQCRSHDRLERDSRAYVSCSGNWAFNFALGYFVPPAFVSIQWRVYILFGVFCLAMTLHVFFLFPETAGKPLEVVNEMFEDPNGIRYLGTPAWKTKTYMSRSGGRRFEDESGDEKRISDDEKSPKRHHEDVKQGV